MYEFIYLSSEYQNNVQSAGHYSKINHSIIQQKLDLKAPQLDIEYFQTYSQVRNISSIF